MEQTYRHLVCGCTVPQALRLAMLRLARRPALHQPAPGNQETGTSTDTVDVADGLQEAWRRPMHWAGFLVMGASTCLPRGNAKEGGSGMKGWTIEQVETFVQGLAHEFGEKANVYAETLKREGVNGETLLGLSEDDLKGLGFSLGHRRKLLACIQRSS